MATLTPSVMAQLWGEKIGEATTPTGYPLDVYRDSRGHLSYRNPWATNRGAIDKDPRSDYFHVHVNCSDRMADTEAEALIVLDALLHRD